MAKHTGKNVIVTGGASGLGDAICRRLAEEGANVVIADVDEEAGKALAKELDGDNAFHFLDVSSPESWDEILGWFTEKYGTLHCLVNNAGIAPPADLMMDFETWRKVMSIDLDGVFLGTQKGVQVMRDQDERGAIINMSSVMAYVGQDTTPAYSASKAGVIGLTKAAVAYCGAHNLNIRVNTIHPGTHETPILINALPHLPEGFKEAELGRHPVGHFGDPAGLGATVSFLMQDDAEFYQGAEFVIDGGRLSVDR